MQLASCLTASCSTLTTPRDRCLTSRQRNCNWLRNCKLPESALVFPNILTYYVKVLRLRAECFSYDSSTRTKLKNIGMKRSRHVKVHITIVFFYSSKPCVLLWPERLLLLSSECEWLPPAGCCHLQSIQGRRRSLCIQLVANRSFAPVCSTFALFMWCLCCVCNHFIWKCLPHYCFASDASL